MTTASTIIISNYFIKIFRGIFPRFFLVYYTIVLHCSILYIHPVLYMQIQCIIDESYILYCILTVVYVCMVHVYPVYTHYHYPHPPYTLYIFYNLNCLQLYILPSMLWEWQGGGRGEGIQKIFFIFVNYLQKTKAIILPWARGHKGFSTLSC